MVPILCHSFQTLSFKRLISRSLSSIKPNKAIKLKTMLALFMEIKCLEAIQ